MTPTELLQEIHAAGIQLAVTESGNIKVRGIADEVQKWTPAIKQHKQELVELLNAWRRLYAAILACCAVRGDSDSNRIALLADCLREEPSDWGWWATYFEGGHFEHGGR